VLYGRSAVLNGGSLRDGETFTVVDLFEAVTLTTGLRPFSIPVHKHSSTSDDPQPCRQVLIDLTATGAAEHYVPARGGSLEGIWQPRT